MTTPIQLINNGTTASSCADCADDWESHPLLAGYDEEAALSEMPCATWESGFFVGEVFCAWAEWAGSWASTRPSQEHAAAQREQGAARQREQEEARQREQETARQREQEAAWQREQEAARHVRALGLAQPKPEPLHADTEWTETASVASSRTTVRHATRTVVCIICGEVGHDANTGCTKGLCFRCKRPGHVARKCPQARLAEERRRLERSCYACGQPGHFARDCRTSASAQRA
jgi:hypothetical protein